MAEGIAETRASGGAPDIAFSLVERVRWEDVDLVGIMRYSAYTRLYDIAEAELFRAIGLAYPAAAERLGIWLVRKVLHTEYHAPARFDAALLVRMWFGHVGTTSLTMHVDVANEDGSTRHTSGHLVLVCVGLDMTKRPLPAELCERIAPYVLVR